MKAEDEETEQRIDAEMVAIYDAYLMPKAMHQINLSYDIFTNVMTWRDTMETLPLSKKRGLFDLCVHEVELLLQLSVMSPFCESDEFAQYLRCKQTQKMRSTMLPLKKSRSEVVLSFPERSAKKMHAYSPRNLNLHGPISSDSDEESMDCGTISLMYDYDRESHQTQRSVDATKSDTSADPGNCNPQIMNQHNHNAVKSDSTVTAPGSVKQTFSVKVNSNSNPSPPIVLN